MDIKKCEEIAKDIYCCLKVLDNYCEYNEYSEIASPMKPIIKYAETLADELWFLNMAELDNK